MALGRLEGERAVVLERHVYPSREFSALELVVETFLLEPQIAPHARSIESACFAVAGPVTDGRATLTNLAWTPDETEIAERFALKRARIINDFAAAALGIASLADDDLLTLQAGIALERGPCVVVGAGTGLGVALLDWDEGGYEVHPSEAGHSDFAPVDALQDQLLVYLRRQFERVSCERVVCGAGLTRILDFLTQSAVAKPSAALVEAMANADPAQAISTFALGAHEPLAMQTLDLFVSAYGAFAGNMALAIVARGGVYIAGGIAPKIARKLTDGTFVRAFAAKGRFRPLLETIPIKVVMNEQVGLLGALAEAARWVR